MSLILVDICGKNGVSAVFAESVIAFCASEKLC